MTPQMIQIRIENLVTTAEYPRLQALLHGAGGGAWVREVSLTLALAARANVRLDEETLIYSDVRDLMALQQSLRQAAR